MVRLKDCTYSAHARFVRSFNSNMVRLKGIVHAQEYVLTLEFQFQYGAIKRIKENILFR